MTIARRILRAHLESRPRTATEGGLVLVWSALLLTALLAVGGLAVDVGNWYLQAQRIQRAADGAALSGVTKMPDTAAAVQVARESLLRNGFSDGPGTSVQFDIVPVPPSRLEVKVSNQKVPAVFATFVLKDIAIRRDATAEFRRSIPMGSPFNALGTGNRFTSEDPVKNEMDWSENFWLAVNGYCTAREDGDPRLSRYQGNKISTTQTICTPTGDAEPNPEYDPHGYDYIVQMPPDGEYFTMVIIDPYFAPDVLAPDLKNRSDDIRHSDAPEITTIFTLYDATNTDDPDAQPVVYSKAYGTIKASEFATHPDAAAHKKFHGMTGPSLRGKKFRFNVRTTGPSDAGYSYDKSYGTNSFGLVAAFNPDWGYRCDIRKHPTGGCIQVYGLDAMSIQVMPKKAASLYFADIPAGAAGRSLEVDLFDPGENAESIELRLPNGQQSEFTWDAQPNVYNKSYLRSTTPVSVLPLDGNLQPEDRVKGTISDAVFNARTVTLRTHVPLNYTQYLVPGGDESWWRIRYKAGDGGSTSDRATFSVRLADGSPAHLVPD